MTKNVTIAVRKINQSREVDFASLPQVAQDFVIQYGLTQILNDCHSSIKAADFEAEGEFAKAVANAVDAKLASLVAGDLTRRNAAAPIDPVERKARQFAQAAIFDAAKAKGIKRSEIAKDDLKAMLDALMASDKGEGFRQTAREELARLAAAPKVTINLDDLLA